MELETLRDIGFEEKEAKIYLRLLHSGSASASSLAKDVGYDRTTTYYVLLRMLDKGFVSQINDKGVKYFKSTNPKDILNLLEKKRDVFKSIVPKLEKLQGDNSESLVVEVRQGKEGLNFLYRDVISIGEDVLGLGVDDSQYIDFDKIHLDQYYRDIKEKKIRERLITYKKAKVYGHANSEYRVVDKSYFQPTPIFVYGDKVVVVTWKPALTLVFMKSDELADSFRKHFELLWKIAKPHK